ncbi:MAG: 16S rRNA (cytosine(1402)-N(4))-methyltransferase RsmH [Puniceicoccales bacterium]|jgi:16S rRNA (cytosine1402-N4)-methyltransferase|nr:16S rRNA (cytosine(1402)-N(4))-methyltransferase RsmH [Puniceicoccales bacterium]
MTEQKQLLTCHRPVLLEAVMEWLRPARGGKFLDCTFGGGGHSAAILQANGGNFVYAIDCDPDAKKRAQEFSLCHGNFRFYQMNFAESHCLQLPPLDGILMDLGLSSFQLDSDWRGFSFKHHTTLDMRMDNRQGISAAEFLQTASERDLITAIRDYGEEEQWKKIVRAILENRANRTTFYADTLAKIIANCVSKRDQHGIHPATKTFQGIRIFINDELRAIEMALPALFDKLAIGGRLAVISFHSLEDRIVKRFFNQMAGKATDKTDSRPQQDRIVFGTILTKKPLSPSDAEIGDNHRSRSAKLRVLEKIRSYGERK